ncbi:MAG: NAD(P)-dependent oxidoreductase [bacterium]|nr:NAD(P)-dependent oxidoreductase [bacterium]
MNIKIIFPKKFFTNEQLDKLKDHEVKFIEGSNLDLDKIDSLFSSEEYILVVNPTYLKDNWNAFPIKRIRKMKGLKVLCLTTSSFSWIDTKKLEEMGIIVTNIPGAPTEAVAEFNIFMMLSLLRKLPLIVKNEWKMDYDRFLNEEFKGLQVGVLGLGKIGTRVAELCKGMGLNVVYWNRNKKDTTYKTLSLDQLFETSDIIFNTLATPPDLKGFINKNILSKLKETAIIVSTSDIYIFNEEFILNQVAQNKLGGFAFESKDKKISDFKGNIMVFPEQAYYTLGTQLNRGEIAIETVLSILKGTPINKVN